MGVLPSNGETFSSPEALYPDLLRENVDLTSEGWFIPLRDRMAVQVADGISNLTEKEKATVDDFIRAKTPNELRGRTVVFPGLEYLWYPEGHGLEEPVVFCASDIVFVLRQSLFGDYYVTFTLGSKDKVPSFKWAISNIVSSIYLKSIEGDDGVILTYKYLY